MRHYCRFCEGDHSSTECDRAEPDDFEPDETICPGCEGPLAGTGWCASCEDYAADIATFQEAVDARRADKLNEDALRFLMQRDKAA